MRKIFVAGIILPVLLLVFVACVPSPVKMLGSWMDYTMSGYSINKVLVIGVTRDERSRKLWEDTFVELLKDKGVQAKSSLIVMGKAEEKPNRNFIKSVARKAGVKTVLIARLADNETESFPGATPYEPLLYYKGMSDYYDHACKIAYSPPNNATRTTVHLESNLYDAVTEKLIWTAHTEAVDPKLLKSDFSRMAELLLADLSEKKLL